MATTMSIVAAKNKANRAAKSRALFVSKKIWVPINSSR
jgi:hypothetical protein